MENFQRGQKFGGRGGGHSQAHEDVSVIKKPLRQEPGRFSRDTYNCGGSWTKKEKRLRGNLSRGNSRKRLGIALLIPQC